MAVENIHPISQFFYGVLPNMLWCMTINSDKIYPLHPAIYQARGIVTSLEEGLTKKQWCHLWLNFQGAWPLKAERLVGDELSERGQ